MDPMIEMEGVALDVKSSRVSLIFELWENNTIM